MQIITGFEIPRESVERVVKAGSPGSGRSRTIGRSATPPIASRAVRASTIAAQATMAKSPCRRPISRNAYPMPARATGNRTASIISSSRRSVDIMPVKNALPRPGVTVVATAARSRRSSAMQNERQLGARIGMRDRAANSAATARLGMADPRQRRGKKRLARDQVRVLLERAAAVSRRRRGSCLRRLRCDQSRQLHDVDQHARPRHAHVEHRHQRLSAGENAGVAAFVCQHRERLIEALGAHIVERAGFALFPVKAACAPVQGRE